MSGATSRTSRLTCPGRAAKAARASSRVPKLTSGAAGASISASICPWAFTWRAVTSSLPLSKFRRQFPGRASTLRSLPFSARIPANSPTSSASGTWARNAGLKRVTSTVSGANRSVRKAAAPLCAAGVTWPSGAGPGTAPKLFRRPCASSGADVTTSVPRS